MCNNKKIASISLNVIQLRNLAQGLNMLHSKIMDNLNAINITTEKGTELKKYFVEKQKEVAEQIQEVNELLNTF